MERARPAQGPLPFPLKRFRESRPCGQWTQPRFQPGCASILRSMSHKQQLQCSARKRPPAQPPKASLEQLFDWPRRLGRWFLRQLTWWWLQRYAASGTKPTDAHYAEPIRSGWRWCSAWSAAYHGTAPKPGRPRRKQCRGKRRRDAHARKGGYLHVSAPQLRGYEPSTREQSRAPVQRFCLAVGLLAQEIPLSDAAIAASQACSCQWQSSVQRRGLYRKTTTGPS